MEILSTLTQFDTLVFLNKAKQLQVNESHLFIQSYHTPSMGTEDVLARCKTAPYSFQHRHMETLNESKPF